MCKKETVVAGPVGLMGKNYTPHGSTRPSLLHRISLALQLLNKLWGKSIYLNSTNCGVMIFSAKRYDIGLLSQTFLEKFADKNAKQLKTLFRPIMALNSPGHFYTSIGCSG